LLCVLVLADTFSTGRPHCHRFFEGYGIVRVIIVVLLLIIGLRAVSLSARTSPCSHLLCCSVIPVDSLQAGQTSYGFVHGYVFELSATQEIQWSFRAGGTSACTLVGTIALGLWFKAFHRSPVFGHVLFTGTAFVMRDSSRIVSAGLVDALLVVFSLWQTEKLLVATSESRLRVFWNPELAFHSAGSGAIQGCRSGPGSIDRNLLLDDDPLADLQLQLPSSRMRFSLALPPRFAAASGLALIFISLRPQRPQGVDRSSRGKRANRWLKFCVRQL